MTRSMTAYAKAEVATSGRIFTCEIHSLNRKGLEITAYFPKEFVSLEIPIKKYLKQRLWRGQVMIRLSSMQTGDQGELSKESLKSLHDQLEKIAKEIRPDFEVSFDSLLEIAMKQPSLGAKDLDGEELYQALERGFSEAFERFEEMKKSEGADLEKDLQKRNKALQDLLQEVKEAPKTAPQEYRKKLENRIAEVKTVDREDRDRILREIALYSDKIDTTEELVRLASHLKQFDKLLSQKDQSIGRNLDFLLQEMMREVNTFTSKTVDLPLVQKALEMKGEIEKMREQVQNIE